ERSAPAVCTLLRGFASSWFNASWFLSPEWLESRPSEARTMKIRDAKDCKYDLVAWGECMLRLSPPQHGRIEFAPMLEVWVGGGEYNVSYALARLGLRTGWVGGLNSSPMGAIIRNHARSVGMGVEYVVERKYDGVGNKDRIGLNFTEVGVAKRASATLYD